MSKVVAKNTVPLFDLRWIVEKKRVTRIFMVYITLKVILALYTYTYLYMEISVVSVETYYKSDRYFQSDGLYHVWRSGTLVI